MFTVYRKCASLFYLTLTMIIWDVYSYFPILWKRKLWLEEIIAYVQDHTPGFVLKWF